MNDTSAQGDILVAIFFLAWLGFGVWLSYRTREFGCGTKILVAIFCTKGFLLFWLFYGAYLLLKSGKYFIQGIQEGRAEKNEKEQVDKDS